MYVLNDLFSCYLFSLPSSHLCYHQLSFLSIALFYYSPIAFLHPFLSLAHDFILSVHEKDLPPVTLPFMGVGGSKVKFCGHFFMNCPMVYRCWPFLRESVVSVSHSGLAVFPFSLPYFPISFHSLVYPCLCLKPASGIQGTWLSAPVVA